MPDTWYPPAHAAPGPEWKTGGGGEILRPSSHGAVVHSAEGSLEGALAVLHGDREASWHFTVAKGGRVYQHYPLDAWTWHAGPLNADHAGIECEGVAGEALTDPQLAALVGLLQWIAHQESWPGYVRGQTLREHNEVMATACPSGRIVWDIVIALCLGAPKPSAETQLRALVAAAFVLSIGHPLSDLSQEDRDAVRYVASQL